VFSADVASVKAQRHCPSHHRQLMLLVGFGLEVPGGVGVL
jgi:hypothetical protein